MNVHAHRYKQRLDYLFKQISALPSDPELQSHWARYLCVLVSGFIETSVIAIYTKYAEDKSTKQIASYVERQLDRFQNPTMERILSLTYSFSTDWGHELKKATEGELKAAIDSIVANRNNIAHGQDVTITYARIHEYYKSAVKVIEMIDKQCST